MRRDLSKLPIVYYFTELRQFSDLPCQIAFAYDLAERAREHQSSSSGRLRAQMLDLALDNFSRTLAEEILVEDDLDREQTLHRYLEDHLCLECNQHTRSYLQRVQQRETVAAG